ncbi:hypothetical protein ACFLXI_07940 [Chloroflexota bacterium]
MTNSSEHSFILLLVFGSLFICMGASIFLISVDVIHMPEENFNAPRWVVAAVGAAFSLAGVMVTLNGLKDGLGDYSIFKWIYNTIFLMFMILFAAPFNWVAFGPGVRSFSNSTSSNSITVGFVSVIQKSGSEIGGRLAFGLGAVLMNIFIVYILIRIIQGKNISNDE